MCGAMMIEEVLLLLVVVVVVGWWCIFVFMCVHYACMYLCMRESVQTLFLEREKTNVFELYLFNSNFVPFVSFFLLLFFVLFVGLFCVGWFMLLLLLCCFCCFLLLLYCFNLFFIKTFLPLLHN